MFPNYLAKVAEQLCRARRNKEIAAELRLSESTVKQYVSKIFEICKVRNRTEFVIKYYKIYGETDPN